MFQTENFICRYSKALFGYFNVHMSTLR